MSSLPEAVHRSPTLYREKSRRCQIFLGPLEEDGCVGAYRIDESGGNSWLTPLFYPQKAGTPGHPERFPFESYNRGLREAAGEGFLPCGGEKAEELTAGKVDQIKARKQRPGVLQAERAEKLLRAD